ncbi:hypothetical protein C3729_01820 [Cloacibacterium normanense]|uniref:site-specific DNA-methyltransferase (adenine-specific) n=1 Tax=Cloacibacterium normanense TaxID=237258 RepID=A0A2S7I863_9FLAO|nr:N-6 DNA methylase [Cloacibacterium normanense]PPZ92768.1 hypothetical protein C3729_01820 [Cloacibacterium normanense]
MVNIVYSNPVDVLSFKVIGILNSFRYNSKFNNTSDSVQITLLLISLYKDGVINEDSFTDDFDLNKLKSLIVNSVLNSQTKEAYIQIVETLNNSLTNLFNQPFDIFLFQFFQLDRKMLVDYFPSFFEDILYKISKSQGRYAGEFIQPVELTRLMSSLADLKKDAKVFNPFAGLASFGVCLDKEIAYLGQEISEESWALGTLRLLAHNKLSLSNYVCVDSTKNWPSSNEKFDLVIAHPPFNMKFDRNYHNVNSVEQFLIERGLESLDSKGNLISILPLGFLSREGYEKQLRRELIQQDVLDTIISLPGGLLSNTGIPLVILMLNKNKKKSGLVRFVDASEFVEEKDGQGKILNDNKLSELIHNTRVDSEFIRFVSNEQIISNKYSLSVPRYFLNEIIFEENERLVKLGDILELVRGQRGNLPESGKLIRIRDLKDDKVDFTLDISNVEETELRRSDIHIVSESCLLLAMRWRSLKPTFFEFKDEPIFRSQDIFSFKVNEEIVDKAYLINELQSEYVNHQLDSYRLGATIPFIRQKDLLEVVIKLPSLEEQRAKVQVINELSDKIKSLQEERNALVHGKTIKQFNEFASLKHTLGRPRQNILDWSDNLLDFLTKKKNDFEELNKVFSDFYDIDIISALKEIKRDVNFITDVLEKGENGLVLSEYEKQIISLSDINSTVNELSNNGFHFTIKKFLLKGEKLKERGIYANKTLFKTLLDNILTNANKYAFDKKAIGNEVIIELTEVDDSLVMEIRNNGKPFPKNFDREKFITKYSTADSNNGSGLGGYDIHRIASDFNNPDWILSLNEDPFFLVKFKFQFPIKLIN